MQRQSGKRRLWGGLHSLRAFIFAGSKMNANTGAAYQKWVLFEQEQNRRIYLFYLFEIKNASHCRCVTVDIFLVEKTELFFDAHSSSKNFVKPCHNTTLLNSRI